jgi:spore coat polysaccharide biosynthesis protein SpsF (cytidylyltransferase family)
MKVVAILQQRMGSKRLPGKALLPLAGKSMTENIIERVKRAKRLDHVVLAVPPQDENAFAWMPCRVHAPLVDENDLVARYLTVAERCHADIIVRVPCDNPCIEPEYIDDAVERFLTYPYLFYSNTTALVETAIATRPRVYVDGIGAEVFTISRLKWLDERTKGSSVWREHPHKFFHDNEVDVWKDMRPADLRLDVNTMEDYMFIKGIYDHFGHNNFHVNDVLAYLEAKK